METTNPTPAAEPTPDERTWAMLSHLGAVILLFLSGGVAAFLCPLVIWLVKKDESEFIAEHAKESLNFQISFWLILFIYACISGLLVCLAGLGILLLLLLPLFIVPAAFFGVMASIAANRGEIYRYPYALRLIA